ncbi:MAG: PKD domain-containing protein [bacterium]|nr:PKD domain-containing protein [bacterium]
MKRVSKLLSICLATLALAFLATGCKEDNKPRITRMNVSPACGVAPVEVIATAYVSGGDETGDPLGGNNGLDMTWNYGDGGTGSTSVSYHTYNTPGEYTVVVTATDPGGEAASASVPVTVLADSLVVVASTNFPDGTLTTDDIVQFDASVVSCDVDFPVVPGDAVKLAFRWEMNDATNQVFTGSSPDFKFVTAGEYDVELSVTYPAWAVTRHQTIHLSVSSNTSAK